MLSHVTFQMPYVDPWDMLNNFCLYVYASPMSPINTDVVNILLFVNSANNRDATSNDSHKIISRKIHNFIILIVVALIIRAWVNVVYNAVIGIVNNTAPGSPFPDVPAGVRLVCFLPRRREDSDRQRHQGLRQRRRQGGKLLLSWWLALGSRTHSNKTCHLILHHFSSNIFIESKLKGQYIDENDNYQNQTS